MNAAETTAIFQRRNGYRPSLALGPSTLCIHDSARPIAQPPKDRCSAVATDDAPAQMVLLALAARVWQDESVPSLLYCLPRRWRLLPAQLQAVYVCIRLGVRGSYLLSCRLLDRFGFRLKIHLQLHSHIADRAGAHGSIV